MWCKVITKGRVFDESTDAKRFQEAFLSLAARKTWPVPSDFIEALPSKVVPFQRHPKLDSDDNRRRNMMHIAEISKKLGINVPKVDDNNGPEAA